MKKTLKIILIALMTVGCISLVAQSKTPQKRRTKTTQVKTVTGIVNEISAQQFKQLVANYASSPYRFKGKRPAVVDVYASWCGPCKRLSPIMDRLAERYKGQVDFYRIDGDKYRDIMSAYGFTAFPTVMFWDSEGFLDTYRGLGKETMYVNKINRLF